MEHLHHLSVINYIESYERRERNSNPERICDLDLLDGIDFKAKYRICRSSAENLLSEISDKLSSRTTRNNALAPEEKLCIALRYLSSGAHQQIIGDIGQISQSSCCRAIHEVSSCIAELKSRYIYLPDAAELREISRKFQLNSGFPGVYGAIDCTHIPIISPGGNYSEIFRNRKGYYSLNVQTVSDSNLYIRNIVARWPGSTHDSTIFDNCRLRAEFESQLIPPAYHLIGDNGYGCRTYLLTPFLNPQTQAQKRYNASHIRARNVVERQYGVWKRRFACLATEMRCSLKNSMTIIIATAVLHNIARSLGDYLDDEDEIILDEDFETITNPQNQNGGLAKRATLTRQHFE